MRRKTSRFLTGTVLVVSLFMATPLFAEGENIKIAVASAISGNALTIAVGDKDLYTLDATRAKVLKNRTEIGVSDIKVGDTLIIRNSLIKIN